VCEEVDGRREVTYALEPDVSESDVVIRTADRKNLSLVFSSSCLVRDPVLTIAVSVEAGPEDGDDLPSELATQAEVNVRRDELTVVLPIRRSALDAGQYDANVVLSGNDLATVRTPVTVSIKDQRWYWGLGAALLGAAIGLAIAAFSALTNTRDDVDPIWDTWRLVWSRWGAVAAAAAIGVALVGPFRDAVLDNDRYYFTVTNAIEIGLTSLAAAAGTTVVALLSRPLVKRLPGQASNAPAPT
jgi:hypothetical protein